MLDTLPPELIGEVANRLNIKEQGLLTRVSKNIYLLFNSPKCNSNEFKKLRNLHRLYQLKPGELMTEAEDIEIAKMILKDQKLFKNFKGERIDHNIIQLAKKHPEIAEIILNNNTLLNKLKHPEQSKEKLSNIIEEANSKKVLTL